MQHTTHNRDTKQAILHAARMIISRKGFASAGLNEILAEAGVPKGSFYHYFKSKDMLGVEVLETYFDSYLSLLDEMFQTPAMTGRERLMLYWKKWCDTQKNTPTTGKCLTVKLGAEVSDMSEPMRRVLIHGTTSVVDKITQAIEYAIIDGSVKIAEEPKKTAEMLYKMWLGSTLMVKITRDNQALIDAYVTTERVLSTKN
ncbi:TetR/AcrR family transcriptional regulator [Acetobacter suratthaniensis]|uniref:TetR/AcrR family transcriptional regulator n=1 Tax=Acetobacter suratthaniensis TaxID=1502841 RepID=A0ABS3LQ87_9PROT|nr:TetR/AcrR family transcriptional regulator [Acetobacter suratthaniensis]MBO1329528.1 TetR/AcrR family transcriptional regulator [Acetobacter suratthaniensis]MCX2567412.1 TetR/AcrR family transcriptional regulator [Acetobacter suratthaniensis]